MTQTRKHVVILPHFCEEEVDRYLRIATLLKSWPKPKVETDFLLAASPKRKPSQRLVEAYQSLGNAIPFQCPTQIFGYPEGPTAMFWDCMEYVEQAYQNNDGFSLWLESDMCPTQSDWIDRLSQMWYSGSQRPLMMGCYVPEVYKYRILKRPKRILEPHINGGACYAMNFASQMPTDAREGVFDMAVYQFAKARGLARECRAISFSTTDRVRRDLMDASKVLLHGFMQEKDEFIEDCIRPLDGAELQKAKWNALQEQIETTRRKLRVWFVRRGREAMLENMFLAKQRYEQDNPVEELAETTHSRKAA
ncbi:hypothetical protein [Mariniblastus fucicola]|uniref:Glycosyltransferase n=1 Tax=Mariniblastus fucicola TaxID=980251 RepID=A0A5B9PHQ8_9BACT|nr:hypothetical protein [Mariniblastus fucicola]QEG22411.1 hypothetical protein MFFC18_22910 [Mariniblastus fucicola]